jgi:hypothetical protein
MARLRLGIAALLTMLVSAGCARGTSTAPHNVRTLSAPTPTMSPRSIAEPVNPPFPGGGRILFLAEQAPGDPTDGMGIVAADGSTQYFGHDALDAMWDPSARSRVVVVPRRDGAPVRWYRLAHRQWDPAGRTKVDGAAYFAKVSPDGRLFASNHLHRGRLTKEIRVVDRAGRLKARLSAGYVRGWADAQHVLVAAWSEPGELYLWDIRQRFMRLFLSRTTLDEILPAAATSMGLGSSMPWSDDRRLFAMSLDWSEGRTNGSVVLIGSSSGTILRIIDMGRRVVLDPTWSPVRSELAIASVGRHGYRTRVELYDVASARRRVLSRSGGWPWAAWSPSGRWLLIEDSRRSRWLFISRDGRRQVSYPWLGSGARWSGSPGTDVHVPVC